MPLSRSTRIDRLLARSDLARSSCNPNEFYWYRPRQLLVEAPDFDAVSDEIAVTLRRWGAERLALPGNLESLDGLGVTRYLLPPQVSVPAAVRQLRSLASDRQVRLSPNYVFGAAPDSGFGPGDVAQATADTLPLPAPNSDGAFTIAVLDAGLVLDPQTNPHLADHQQMILDPKADEDALDQEPADGMLDDADVHGGFIADLLRFLAPQATVRAAKVLLGGTADVLEITNGILRVARETGAHIINLSLGGYTDGDVPPSLIDNALQQLDPRPVVVAAAGNHAAGRPFWPAALEGVIGVAAVDAPDGAVPGGMPTPAPFTNHGPWVNACAHGVNVLSTYAAFAEQRPDPQRHPITDLESDPQRFTGWARWSGTSFAAPRVAARIAVTAEQLSATDPFDAVHQAAQRLLTAGAPIPGLGVFVP